ncbi:RNA polymerase sigma factor [Patulibacter sp. NPDC049589]|uniref:RNA polymerase sigma factor n=1 Tax=Patulibacter sp. NPDC049589 TaxID=3154731 RepID=UPI003448BD21
MLPDDRDDLHPAFADLYREHLPTITRYLRRRLGDAPAEDAAAEVFVRALRGLATYEQSSASLSALPWLYGIAANVIREQRRAETRRLRTVERLLADPPAASPDAPEREALDPRLARALRGLPPADRETLLLVAWGELTYEETALALGIPVGTVRSRIARSRKRLDDGLGAEPRPHDARALTGETHA